MLFTYCFGVKDLGMKAMLSCFRFFLLETIESDGCIKVELK